MKNKLFPIYLLGLLSVGFFALMKFLPAARAGPKTREMIRAAEMMAQAAAVIRNCAESKNFELDQKTDINRTGLIGRETSSTTTSLGNLEAKRTTTNPNFAALLVLLLREAGVRQGETIAVGASGSFPALVVAAFSASKALGLKLLLISSLGASQWGANRPEFSLLEMENCLEESGLFRSQPLAVSLGGEGDVGKDMSPDGRRLLLEKIRRAGVYFIDESDLAKNVGLRMKLYEDHAGGSKIKAFVNIGGSSSEIGTDPSVLKLVAGLTRLSSISPPEKRGVLQEMASRGVPVVHLLHIHGLANRYGLPWDPSPLPRAGEGEIYRLAGKSRMIFVVAAVSYLVFVTLILMGVRSGLLTRT